MQLGESNINLFNFYRNYVQEPERFEDIILPALATVAQVQKWDTAQSEPTLASVRDRILPMLYPEDVWRRSFPNFVGTPWVGDLMVLYVVDEQHAYWYIRDDMLDRWTSTAKRCTTWPCRISTRYFERQQMEYVMGRRRRRPDAAHAQAARRL